MERRRYMYISLLFRPQRFKSGNGGEGGFYGNGNYIKTLLPSIDFSVSIVSEESYPLASHPVLYTRFRGRRKNPRFFDRISPRYDVDAHEEG